MSCCEALYLYLDRVTVVEPTDGPGDDDLMVTIESTGRFPTEPRVRSWPGGPVLDVEIEKGRWAPPRPVEIARIEADSTCKVDFKTTVMIWEADASDLHRALRATAGAARQWAGASVPAPGGAGDVVEAALDLAQAILEGIIDLLGFGDDLMGPVQIGGRGRLNSTTPLATWTWLPAWSTTGTPEEGRLEVVDDDHVRFHVSIFAHGGQWDVVISAQRVCEPEEDGQAADEQEQEGG